MQMRGNLHRYRVSPVRKKNRMLQGTFMPSYSPVLKNAGYGLLLTLLTCETANEENRGRVRTVKVDCSSP